MSTYSVKIFNIIVSFFSYLGLGLGIDEKFLEGFLMKNLNLDNITTNFLFGLAIIMWILRIVWFVYDKFILERKERKITMEKTLEEIRDLKNDN